MPNRLYNSSKEMQRRLRWRIGNLSSPDETIEGLFVERKQEGTGMFVRPGGRVEYI